MRLVAAGVSYRAAPLRTREAAAAAVGDAATLLRYLIGHAGITGAAVLSTCNRTEFYLTCPDEVAEEAGPRLAQYLDPTGRAGVASHLTSRHDLAATTHLFRVAAGLESMLVGEAQVLGQLKAAHRTAREAGTLDARLDYVLRRAVSAGKRVRTETSIGRAAGSLSEAALDCAEQVLGDLRGRGVLLLGAGKMSTRAARRLEALGCPVLVSSRSDSAARLAGAVDGRAVPFAELVDAAGGVDVVLASTSSPDTVLDAATVSAMQRRREERPLCIIDIAVPRDVDPTAAALPGVTLIDIDALGERLEASLSQHNGAVAEAASIVAAEAAHTVRVLEERDSVAPTIAALLRRAEAQRRTEVERTFSRAPQLDEAARERVEVMTRSLVRKLLHAPLSHLREHADDPSVALTIREAFDLED
jgi:glutamyl-tRNA reductase